MNPSSPLHSQIDNSFSVLPNNTIYPSDPQQKNQGFLYKRSDHLRRWRKRFVSCESNFLKICHNQEGKKSKIHDLSEYTIKWQGKAKDKYVFSLKIRKGIKRKTKEIVLSSTDEGLAKHWHKLFLTVMEPHAQQVESMYILDARTKSLTSKDNPVDERNLDSSAVLKKENMSEIANSNKKRPLSAGRIQKISSIAKRKDDSSMMSQIDFLNDPGTDNSQDAIPTNSQNLLKNLVQEARNGTDDEEKSVGSVQKGSEFSLPREAPKWAVEIYEKCIKGNSMWKNHGEETNKNEWTLLKSDSRLKIVQSKGKPNVYRCAYALEAGATKEKVLQILLDVQNRDRWDPYFQKANTLSYIHSTKQCVIHQVYKPYGILYFPREVVYSRYIYRSLDSYFILDKSVEEQPEVQKSMKCPRSNIEYSITHITESSGQLYLNMLLNITNGGLLSYAQEAQITSYSLSSLKNLHNVFDQYEGWDEFEMDFMPTADDYSQFEPMMTEAIETTRDFSSANLEQIIPKSPLGGNRDDEIPSKKSPVSSPMLARPELEIVLPKSKPIEEFKISQDSIGFLSPKKAQAEPALAPDNLNTILEKVKSQKTTLDCISKQVPTIKLTQNEIDAIIPDSENDIINGKMWIRDPANGLRFTDEEFLSKQKKVLGHFLRSMGKNLLEGKSIMSVSMPVTIFSNESMLQRASSSFAYAPSLLTLAGKQTDPLEGFKYVVAFYFSTLHTAIGQSKPFNPILGETYEGYLNGIPVCCEQISHHPPISAVFMKTEEFFLHGNQQLDASLGANSATASHKRRLCVTLPKLNMNIYGYFPTAAVSGTTFGKRTFNWTKKMKVYDPVHNLYCEVHLNPDEKGAISGLFSKRVSDADVAKGTIYTVKPEFMKVFHKNEGTLNTDAKAKFNEKEHVVEELASVYGSWISYMEVDNQRLWDSEKMKPYKLIDKLNKALPSDSDFREDIIYVKLGDLQKAQEAKDRLENFQRADKKLREKSGKSKH